LKIEQPKKTILVFDTYYKGALRHLEIDRSLNHACIYQDKICEVEAFGFGTGSAYVDAFRRLGWKAELFVPNSLGLQGLWTKEKLNRRVTSFGWGRIQVAARIPIIRRIYFLLPSFYKVIIWQIKHYLPDVVYIQDLNAFPPFLVKIIGRNCKIVYGEIASPPPPKKFFKYYDRIISALPPLLEMVAGLGVQKSYLALGFDQRFALVSEESTRDIDVAFVGSITRLQPNTVPLLKAISSLVPTLEIYGDIDSIVLHESGLEKFYKGKAWGPEMWKVLSRSKIVINRHGSIAQNFAVNMRMFEATGSGALLVTEDMVNLGELFSPNNEVVVYKSNSEAADLIDYYLRNDSELQRIANSGKKKTLAEHTYNKRIERLIEIIELDLKLLD
jgi:spore maturation protein CgeB